MRKPDVNSKNFQKIYDRTHAEVFGLGKQSQKKIDNTNIPTYKSLSKPSKKK